MGRGAGRRFRHRLPRRTRCRPRRARDREHGPLCAPGGRGDLGASRADPRRARALRLSRGPRPRALGPCRTHPCEPHPANTMRTATGYVLIDWESTQLAPPERDLWDLAPGEPAVLAAYTDRTGTPVRADMLELYRLRWDLTEVALYTHRFREPHADTANDRQSWAGLLHSLSVLATR
ncbi:hypothetical protein D7D52_17585 [Nocardia yunnanensis]|uniref:Aminoglycoside phosphotransferase domain-containing protein n=1 Tax=Nocardia yunnanensis TaxID=2382165 RepID=A0A386ZE27_9NOCA|nr:phosphotransferase [Nocardia yunnanensis]AYF75374.1 hypothetical protein D7D52_17585 [Nocardia yunnanensis]